MAVPKWDCSKDPPLPPLYHHPTHPPTHKEAGAHLHEQGALQSSCLQQRRLLLLLLVLLQEVHAPQPGTPEPCRSIEEGQLIKGPGGAQRAQHAGHRQSEGPAKPDAHARVHGAEQRGLLQRCSRCLCLCLCLRRRRRLLQRHRRR